MRKATQKAITKIQIIIIALIIIIAGTVVGVYYFYYRPTTEPPEPPVPPVVNELIYARPSLDDLNVDPQGQSSAECYQFLHSLYDTLVVGDTVGNVVPNVAESWEYTDDFQNWTFTIRQGIKFHDGTPLNASAIKYTHDRLYNLAQAFVGNWLNIANNESVVVVDEHTVRFNLIKPHPLLLVDLTVPHYGIVSPTTLNSHATTEDPWAFDWLQNGHDAGSGPYMITEHVPGERLVFEKFDDYWGGTGDQYPGAMTSAHIDKIIMIRVTDPSISALKMMSGEVDMAEKIPVDTLLELEKNPNVTIVAPLIQKDTFLFVNCLKAPYNNSLVRKAIAHAINYEEIRTEIEKGLAERLHGFFPQGMLGYDPDAITYEYNSTKAQELLTQAGYASGFDGGTLIYAPERHTPFGQYAIFIQSYLEDIGITVAVQSMAHSSQLALQEAGDYDMSLMTWTVGNSDPSVLATLFDADIIPQFGWCPTYWYNDTTTNLAKDGLGTINTTEREAIYQELQELAMSDAACMPLLQLAEPFALNDKFTGLEYDNRRRATFWLIRPAD